MMRSFLLLAGIAGLALPLTAVAAAPDDDGPRRMRADRSDRDDRSDRAERAPRMAPDAAPRERAERRPEAPVRFETRPDPRSAMGAERSQRRDGWGAQTSQQAADRAAERAGARGAERGFERRAAGDPIRRMRERDSADTARPAGGADAERERGRDRANQDLGWVGRERPRPPREGGAAPGAPAAPDSKAPTTGTPAPRDGERWSRHGRHDRDWSRNWRDDHRYDWRGHRNRHRFIFRIGRYADPYGWGYRRWDIGYSLFPRYFGSRYWLDDPWMYRLPPVYGPYRWVRYYDDALLVDTFTGEIVDVLYDVFW